MAGPKVLSAPSSGSEVVRKTELDAAIAAVPSSAVSPIVSKTAAFTLTAAEAGSTYLVNSASAIIATVPVNATVAIPVGSFYHFVRYNTGAVTVSPFSGTVLLRNTGAGGTSSVLRVRYSVITIQKVATDEWIVTGDTT